MIFFTANCKRILNGLYILRARSSNLLRGVLCVRMRKLFLGFPLPQKDDLLTFLI